MHGSLLNLLLVDLVAGDELQARHVGPGQLPALLRQVLEGRILTRRGCGTRQKKNNNNQTLLSVAGKKKRYS